MNIAERLNEITRKADATARYLAHQAHLDIADAAGWANTQIEAKWLGFGGAGPVPDDWQAFAPDLTVRMARTYGRMAARGAVLTAEGWLLDEGKVLKSYGITADGSGLRKLPKID